MAIASLNILFRTDISQFSRQFKRAEFTVARFGKKMQAAGRSMTRNLTLPILAVGAASVKMATDVETSFTKIETLVGLSADAVEGFKEEVEGISRKTAKGTKELADALFVVTSAGLRGANAIEVLNTAAQASAIGLGETKDIARATTAVLQAYGEENLSAARATEILLGTVRAGNLEAADLAPVLGRVIGIASQLGISFEEVGASVATFTRLGVSSEEAITGLRGVMNALLKRTPQVEKALASVGLTFDGLRESVREKGLATTLIELAKIFKGNEDALAEVIPNVRALSAVLGTAGAQGEAYAQILKDIEADTDNLGSGMERVAETSAFKFREALNNLKLVAEDIGAKLLPIVVKLAEKVAVLGDKWSKFSDQQIKTRIKILATFAALGPLLVILGKFVTIIPLIAKAFKALSVAMATNPVGLALVAISVALTVLLPLFGRWIGKLKDATPVTQKYSDTIKELKSNMESLTLGELIKEADTLEKSIQELSANPLNKILGQPDNQMIKSLTDRLFLLRREINTRKELAKVAQSAVDVVKPVTGIKPTGKLGAAGFEGEISLSPSKEDRAALSEQLVLTSSLTQKTGALAESYLQLQDALRFVAAEFPGIKLAGVDSFMALEGAIDRYNLKISFATSIISEIGSAITQSFGDATRGIEDFADSVKKAAKRIISAFISQGIAAIISNTLSDLGGIIGPLAIPIAAAAGAAASALFNAAIPSLAGGGLAFGSTLALVGDNPNARIDPEVISPLSKLQGMGGGNVHVTGEFRLRGRDAWILVDEEQKFRDRN